MKIVLETQSGTEDTCNPKSDDKLFSQQLLSSPFNWL